MSHVARSPKSGFSTASLSNARNAYLAKMSALTYDFLDQSHALCYPAHGWAKNSQGIKLLWCPIVGVLGRPDELTFSDARGFQIRPAGGLPDGIPFAQSMVKLAITLKELSHIERIACDQSFVNGDSATLQAYERAREVVPLYVDLAFVYLRRLPDLLARASRPFLFRNWQSVPREFKEWIAHIDKLEQQIPCCDFAVLRHALENYTAWFTALRVSPIPGRKGLRDALEHRPIRLEVGPRQVEGQRPEFAVFARSHEGDVTINEELLTVIRESVLGLSKLLTGVSAAIRRIGSYEHCCAITLVGADDDAVGYWPAIGA